MENGRMMYPYDFEIRRVQTKDGEMEVLSVAGGWNPGKIQHFKEWGVQVTEPRNDHGDKE